jgi:putative heme iron utilization protein
MKIFMGAQGLWAAVEGRQVVDDRLDQMALAAIVQAVPESVMLGVAEQETTKKVWDALKEMQVGEEPVKKSQVQTLKRELDGVYIGKSEKINEFCLKVTTAVNEICSLRTKVEEITVVKKLLRSVPDKFLPIVSTIEQWGDLTMMSMAEVIGHMRTFKESSKG